jgi:hypothetical protein
MDNMPNIFIIPAGKNELEKEFDSSIDELLTIIDKIFI